IFHHAVRYGHYDCFLKRDTRLPMMYLDDCIKGTLALLTHPQPLPQSVYNLGAVSFTPQELAEEIRKYLPNFTISYPDDDYNDIHDSAIDWSIQSQSKSISRKPDFRQAIADSWPRTLDDSKARQD